MWARGRRGRGWGVIITKVSNNEGKMKIYKLNLKTFPWTYLFLDRLSKHIKTVGAMAHMIQQTVVTKQKALLICRDYLCGSRLSRTQTYQKMSQFVFDDRLLLSKLLLVNLVFFFSSHSLSGKESFLFFINNNRFHALLTLFIDN